MGSRVELINQDSHQSWVLQSKSSSSSLPWCQLVWEMLVATMAIMATMETTEDTSHHLTILTHPTTTHIPPHHTTPTLRLTTPTPPTTTPTPPPTTPTLPTVASLTATTTTTMASSGSWSPSRRQLW